MPSSIVVVAQRGSDGKVDHFSAISRDISELRSFEARVESNEAWYRSLVQHAPDLILVIGRSGEVQYASPSCNDVLGVAPEALVGESIAMLALDGEVERTRATGPAKPSRSRGASVDPTVTSASSMGPS
jgi:PAS domain-containing protein